MYDEIVDQASAPSTTSEEKSSLKMSRTTRMAMSGSPWSRAGADAVFDFFSMASHWPCRRAMSARSSSSLAPSAAVRTMTPAESGTISRRIFLRRLRSVSGSLRLMPVMPPPGTYTR